MSGSSSGLRRRTALPRVISRRIALLPLITVTVTLGVFALAALSPLDPLDAYLSGQSAALNEQQRSEISGHLGLDQPWWAAWWQWLTAALGGDLGQSMSYRQSVAQVVLDRLPWTILLSGTGLALALAISLGCGTWAGLHRGAAVDRVISLVAQLLQTVPPFVLGMGAIAVGAVALKLLPSGGLTDPGEGVRAESLARHLVLPTAIFALSQLPWLVLGLRETIVHAVEADSIRAARLRGLARRTIIVRHILPSSAPPFIALVATRLPELVAGSVIVEAVFAWPGIGTAMVQAAQRLDLPLLCLLTVAITTMVLLCGLLADVLYVVLDPRVDDDV